MDVVIHICTLTPSNKPNHVPTQQGANILQVLIPTFSLLVHYNHYFSFNYHQQITLLHQGILYIMMSVPSRSPCTDTSVRPKDF